VLGALAIGAVGAAGYYGYKYLNRKNSKLVDYRTTQYGFGANSPKDAAKTLELESLLAPCVFFEGGIAKLSEKKFDAKKAVGVFNVSPDDEAAYESWVKWFQFRFKPVFLTHLTALSAANPKAKLSDVDDLTPEQKVNYLNLARFQDGPYDYSDTPDKTSDIRLADSKDVEAAYLAAKAEVDDEMSGKKSKVAPAVGAAAVAYDAAGNVISSSDTTSKPKTAMERLKEQQGGVTDYTRGATAAGTAGTMTISGQNAVDKGAGTIGILEGIRLRCYGLVTMETSKVSAIRKLEDLVTKFAVYDGAGNATHKADNVDSLVAGGMFFGISQGTPDAEMWNKWYQTRFLPVYLSYLGMVRQMSGSALKPGISPSLKNSQALAIANQMVATKGIWDVKDTPWPDYVLNSDNESVKPFITALTDLTKSDLTAETAIAKNNGGKITSSTIAETPTPGQAAKQAMIRGNNPSAMTMADPDSEPKTLDGSGAASTTITQPGTVSPMAGGPILEGHGAKQYLSLGKNVNLDGMNPTMLKQFLGMVEEYGQLTGKTVHLESAFRSFEDQARLYRKDPKKAAKPGSSLHEVGLAMDITSTTLNAMEKLGLMRKYGFTRPVGGEAWHVEPAGIQTNIAGYRADPAAASIAIAAGMGKGGGGMGTIANAPLYKRSIDLAKKALEAPVPPATALQPTPLQKAFVPTMVGAAPGVAPSTTGKPEVPSAAGPTGMQYDTMGNAIGNYDAEPKITTAGGKSKAEMLGSTSGRIGNKGQPEVPNQGRGGAMAAVVPGTAVTMSGMPVYKGGKGYGSVKDIILAAAKAVGVDPKLMVPMAAVESSFDPMATPKGNPNGAKGLFQFIDSTWAEVTKKYGRKYGITPETSPFDPVANSLMAAEYIKQNAAAVGKVKSNPNSTDMYAAHFLGAAGAANLFRMDPNANAAAAMPEAAKNNMNIFYDKSRPRTAAEVYAVLNSKMSNALQMTGIASEFSAGDNKLTGAGGIMTASYTPGAAPAVTPALALQPQPKMSIPVESAPRGPVIPTMQSPMAAISGINNGSQPGMVPQERSDMSVAMGTVSNTLIQSLGVQKQMLEVLTNMYGLASKQPNTAPSMNGIDNSKPKVQTSDTTPRNSFSRVGMESNALVPVPMNRV
jgi:hypothetical protein